MVNHKARSKENPTKNNSEVRNLNIFVWKQGKIKQNTNVYRTYRYVNQIVDGESSHHCVRRYLSKNI